MQDNFTRIIFGVILSVFVLTPLAFTSINTNSSENIFPEDEVALAPFCK